MSTRADTETAAAALVGRRAGDHIGDVNLRDGLGNDEGLVILIPVVFHVVAGGGGNGGGRGSLFFAVRKDVVDNLVYEAKDHFFVDGHGGGEAKMNAGGDLGGFFSFLFSLH